VPSGAGGLTEGMPMWLSVDGSPRSPVVDYAWVETNAAPLGVGSSGKVQFGPFTVSRPLDALSTALFQDAATGAHLRDVVLEVGPALAPSDPANPGCGPGCVATYTLSDVVVTSAGISGPGLQKVSFEPTRINLVLKDGTSTLRFCYDVKQARPC
jgi:hypothetical protein